MCTRLTKALLLQNPFWSFRATAEPFVTLTESECFNPATLVSPARWGPLFSLFVVRADSSSLTNVAELHRVWDRQKGNWLERKFNVCFPPKRNTNPPRSHTIGKAARPSASHRQVLLGFLIRAESEGARSHVRKLGFSTFPEQSDRTKGLGRSPASRSFSK